MPRWLRWVLGLILFLVVVWLLFTEVFPLLEQRLVTDPVLGG